MKSVYKFLFAAILAILIAAPIGDATGFSPTKHEFTKNIKKEFPIDSDGWTKIKNKYGKIDVKTWDKNRVKVDVKIIVSALNENIAQEVFNRLKIEFENGDDYVKAETVIGEPKKSVWWTDWNAVDDKTEFKINYEVHMPKSGSLNLKNKYEDSYVEAIDGNAYAEVSYGNIRMEGVKDLELKINHAGGTIVKAKNIVADISNSRRFRIKSANDILFTTNNSKVNVENGYNIKIESRNDAFSFGDINRLKFQGRYGDVDINSVKEVYATGRYSDFYIQKLDDHADFDLQFGGVTVESVERGFSDLTLYGRHTDFKLMIDPSASYTLDAVAESAGITYPGNLTVQHDKDHGVMHEVKGYKGHSGTKSTISAKLNYGGLRIK